MTHRSRSERHVGPLAEEILKVELAKPDHPPHLKIPGPFEAALVAWSRAEAVAELTFSYLDGADLAAALAEVTKEASEEDSTTKGKVRRRSVSRRTVSALDAWFRASAHAGALRRELGLSPVAAARLAKDLGQSRWYAGASPLDKALDAIEAERQAAIEAGGDGG